MVSVLFNEPKLLKLRRLTQYVYVTAGVSVLFNEPKLLKSSRSRPGTDEIRRFSALQRAEIAEIVCMAGSCSMMIWGFSALQRAEIAEIAAGGDDGA